MRQTADMHSPLSFRRGPLIPLGIAVVAFATIGRGADEPPTMAIVPFRLAQSDQPLYARDDQFAGEELLAESQAETTPVADRSRLSSDTSKVPLPPPQAKDPDATETPHSGNSAGMMMTVGSSLAIVVGCYLLFVWLMRRTMPRSGGALPREAIEVLGRTPLDAKQYLQLIRVGGKLLLISVSTAGVSCLCEISDPHEVDELLHLCRHSVGSSSDTLIRDVFHRLGTETSRNTPPANNEFRPRGERVVRGSFSSAGPGSPLRHASGKLIKE